MSVFVASEVCCQSSDHVLRDESCTYQVAWSINPHMVVGGVDPLRARQQHAALIRTVRELGARVLTLPFVHGAFDSVFAKDNGIYVTTAGRRRALMGNPRYNERRIEQQARASALRRSGIEVHENVAAFEGGDVHVLPGGRGVLLGYGFRSDAGAAGPLGHALGLPAVALELVDPVLYHLDTALAILNDGTALVCDEAFSPASRQRIRDLGLGQVIAVPHAEAARFCLNFVEVDDTVVTGTDSPEMTTILRGLGKRVVIVPLDEFQRAGGSAACLLGRMHDDIAQGRVMQAPITAMRSTAA